MELIKGLDVKFPLKLLPSPPNPEGVYAVSEKQWRRYRFLREPPQMVLDVSYDRWHRILASEYLHSFMGKYIIARLRSFRPVILLALGEPSSSKTSSMLSFSEWINNVLLKRNVPVHEEVFYKAKLFFEYVYAKKNPKDSTYLHARQLVIKDESEDDMSGEGHHVEDSNRDVSAMLDLRGRSKVNTAFAQPTLRTLSALKGHTEKFLYFRKRGEALVEEKSFPENLNIRQYKILPTTTLQRFVPLCVDVAKQFWAIENVGKANIVTETLARIDARDKRKTARNRRK